jgi:hypothetical protein
LVCVTPNSGIVQRQVVTVVVKSGIPGESIAIVECNPNLATGDSAACNQNPARLNKPGGPKIAVTNSAGKAVVKYTVVVGTTKFVGDGVCPPGGGTSGVPCFLVAADVATQTPLANPVPFFTQ